MNDVSLQSDVHNAANRGTLTLILGGVRSGKSRIAEELAANLGGDSVLFVATAQTLDDEMRQRVARHRATRPATWRTLEVHEKIADSMMDAHRGEAVVLVDCLTLWVSNWLLRDTDTESKRSSSDSAESQGENDGEGRVRLDANVNQKTNWKPLLDELERFSDWVERTSSHVIVVSGEVGLGVVPESSLGRQFRDLLGIANQTLTRRADRTYWMMAGRAIPLHAVAHTSERIADELQLLGGSLRDGK